MAESINKFIEEIQDNVNELLAETGSTVQAFTKYVLEAMCDKANLGEVDACYAIVRNDSGDKTMGEINGYAISISGETISLFYTLYEPTDDDTPRAISADEYNLAVNRLQGYYNAAANGRCNEMEPSSEDYKICKYIYENDEDITCVRLFRKLAVLGKIDSVSTKRLLTSCHGILTDFTITSMMVWITSR